MTKLKRPVSRETHGVVFSQGKYRPVIITMAPPNVVMIKLKGTRRKLSLTAEAIYMAAERADRNRKQLEKARAKKGKKTKKRRKRA